MFITVTIGSNYSRIYGTAFQVARMVELDAGSSLEKEVCV